VYLFLFCPRILSILLSRSATTPLGDCEGEDLHHMPRSSSLAAARSSHAGSLSFPPLDIAESFVQNISRSPLTAKLLLNICAFCHVWFASAFRGRAALVFLALSLAARRRDPLIFLLFYASNGAIRPRPGWANKDGCGSDDVFSPSGNDLFPQVAFFWALRMRFLN